MLNIFVRIVVNLIELAAVMVKRRAKRAADFTVFSRIYTQGSCVPPPRTLPNKLFKSLLWSCNTF